MVYAHMDDAALITTGTDLFTRALFGNHYVKIVVYSLEPFVYSNIQMLIQILNMLDALDKYLLKNMISFIFIFLL